VSGPLMKSLNRVYILALACLLAATGAFAQQAPPGPSSKTGDPIKDARIHFGMFHLTPTLAIDRFGVDTNVFNAAGEQKSDFTVGIIPQLNIWMPLTHRLMVTSKLSEGINYYKTYADQGSVDPSAAVGAELALRRLKVFGSIDHSESRQRPNFEIDVRVPLISNGRSLGFSVQPTSRTSLELSGYKTDVVYGADASFQGAILRAELTRLQQGVRMRIDRRLTSLTTVHVAVENRQDRFRFSPRRDADGVRTAVGFNFGARALIAGDAEIGFRHMKVASAIIPSFDGLISKVSLNREFRGSTRLHVDWNRDVEFSSDLIHTYYVLNSTNYKIRRQLGGRFDGILGLARHKSTYVKVDGVADLPRTSTKIMTFDVGYRLNRDTRLGFAVERTWRSSDPPSGRDFSGFRAGMSFSVGF
jgi:hypothetical protein